MPKIKIINVTTGEEIEREMNAEELAQAEIDKENAELLKEADESKAAEKQALLDRLGITKEEAKLLLS